MQKRRIAKQFLGEENTYRIIKHIISKKMKHKNIELYYNWKSNRIFHNSHQGERCFILGNGPSLKGVNFHDLTNEFVISVNNFSLVDNFEIVKPNVHLWIDKSFFDLRDDQKYDMEKTMNGYKKMSDVSPLCFVPYVAYDFIKKNKLDAILDIHYLADGKSILDKKMSDFNLDDILYSGTTVIHYAIQVAISFGFSEIYLLGCDTTNIETIINTALEKQNLDMHAYSNDDTEKIYRHLLSKWSMSDVFYDQYLLFLGYKKWNDYCKKRGIVLKNCSSRSLINEIDRIPFNQVINKSS